jgi:hypothetical protein
VLYFLAQFWPYYITYRKGQALLKYISTVVIPVYHSFKVQCLKLFQEYMVKAQIKLIHALKSDVNMFCYNSDPHV